MGAAKKLLLLRTKQQSAHKTVMGKRKNSFAVKTRLKVTHCGHCISSLALEVSVAIKHCSPLMAQAPKNTIEPS